MAKITMKPGTMLNPVPVVLVSCGNMEEPNLITIAWTGIVNSEPPMTYVSVRKSRYSHHLLTASGEFVINLTTEDLAKATDFCGVRSGRDLDKATETGLHFVEAEKVSCPLVQESPVSLECKITEIKEFPTHDMFLAEIVCVHAEETLFDERGKLCLERASLLCYSHGEYFGMKKSPLGKFGYSVMKPKTRKRLNREKMEQKKKRDIDTGARKRETD